MEWGMRNWGYLPRFEGAGWLEVFEFEEDSAGRGLVGCMIDMWIEKKKETVIDATTTAYRK